MILQLYFCYEQEPGRFARNPSLVKMYCEITNIDSVHNSQLLLKMLLSGPMMTAFKDMPMRGWYAQPYIAGVFNN